MRNLLLSVAAFFLFVVGTVMILNRPETIRYVLKTANVKSPWNITLETFSWKPFSNRVVIGGLHLIHKKNAKEAFAKSVNIKYRPWDILRGRFVITIFEIDDVRIAIPPSEAPPEKKRLELNLTRLFILQNIIIKHGIVKGVDLSLPRDVDVKADEMRFGMSRTLFGETQVNIRFDGLALSRAGEPMANAASLTLDTSTALPKWKSEFPYLNALKGSLDIEDGHLEALEIDKLKAKLHFLDNELKLDQLELTIKERSLTGKLSANTQTQNFDASIDIPKPISLPYIGKDMVTIDTAGDLAGSFKISGHGFLPSESSGKAEASFAHRFRISPEIPIVASAKAQWSEGVINISGGEVRAQSDVIKFDGSVDIRKKKIALKGSGTGFPIELFFDKFKNIHFHPIFGKTDFTATFDGWARQFQAKIKGTTHQGGYKPIVATTVETDLDATYDRLSFKWRVVEDNRQTGTADLDIRIGKKIEGQFRSKDIDLKAHMERHPLATALSTIGLSGEATGDLVIKGPHLNFKGQASAQIVNGKWFALPFDKAVAAMDISRKKLTFKDVEIVLHRLNPIIFTQPLTMDLTEGSLRLWGTPVPNLSLDMGYQYSGKRWQIKKISYDDPSTSSHFDVSGGIVSGGGINLLLSGSADLKVLTPLGFLVREVSGPVDMKLAVTGSASNPAINGRIGFNDSVISPRFVRLPLENLKGNVLFDGHIITFDNVSGVTEDGRFVLKGGLSHSGLKLASANIVLEANDLRYRSDDGYFNMEFDGNLTLKGQFPEPLLAGDITILEGRYTKDFNILESITRSSASVKKQRTSEIAFSPQLDLHVRNTGDLYIKNNVGDIWLRADLEIKGTRNKPLIHGAVDVTEGEIHYMGLEFDITRGFVEFRPESESPYLEAVAQREIGVYNVTIEAHGPTDNLALDLSATSPSGALEKRDVISLIAFGMTETEREQMAVRTGEQFGFSMAAQQLTHVIERPVSKFTHLDTFRLEAAEPTSQVISRIRVGKQVSDRLSVDFATDINTQDATQTVTGEYLITDSLLMKGSRSSDGRYEIDGAIRFRLR